MSTTKSASMDPVIASLSTSFGQVPPAAIPAMLDCILASTGLSPLSLYASLLDAFPNLIKDVIKEDEKLVSDRCNYLTSLVGALCHLLKKFGANNNAALQSFIWRSFIPLLRMVHASDREMRNQIAELFVDVVVETNSWAVVEVTLVLFSLRSVGLSVGVLQGKESDVLECSVFRGLTDQANDLGMVKEQMLSSGGSFPLSISCHILNFMLDAALQSLQATPTPELMVANGCYAEKFVGNLIWDLCNVTEKLLLQSLEHRSCMIGFFLPVIFKALVFHRSFDISIHGQTCTLSRKSFLMKIWNCCRALFSLGPLDRRDAYNVLSLYLSFFPCTEECEDAEEFDIRAEKEFWDEIKRGLVDKEGLVRKQSLQILKNALNINGGSPSSSGVSEIKLCERESIPRGMTKREQWADKEAKSMGVGKICNSDDLYLNSHQQWEAFILLYEMLEEYGTHLVEAAWNHQVSLLLQFSESHVNFGSLVNGGVYQNQIQTSSEIFNWLSILWERGFCHDNPQVRCLIMQSFLGIEWKSYGNYAKSVPETFVLGPFIQGLNDPVHHKDFGVKGIYSSRTIEGASLFLQQYTSCLNERKRIAFLSNLASVAKQQSFCRAGLMGLAECIASAACRLDSEAEWGEDAFLVKLEIALESFPQHDKMTLLDVLRFVIESSKQHFNPNYRFRVCEKVLEAAASVVCTFEVPLQILLHFISTLPREFTDYGGFLRVKVQEWLSGCGKKHCSANCCNTKEKLLKSLHDFPKRFTSCDYQVDAVLTYDDEDLEAWEFQAKRWARVLFLASKEEHHFISPFKFIQNYGTNICKQNKDMEWIPVKFLIITFSLVLELQIMQERAAECGTKVRSKSEFSMLETVVQLNNGEVAILFEKFVKTFLHILEELISFANMSCSIFSSSIMMEDVTLPSSVRGKLGGPSQRRLSSSTTTAVLQAVTALKSVAAISAWCAKFKSDIVLNFAFSFFWEFFLKTISSPSCDLETGAEICLAAYEGLAPVLKALVSMFSPQLLDTIRENDKFLLPKVEGTPLLDSLVLSFLQNINNLLNIGVLARTRRAVLMNWKWLCLESLLTIPSYAYEDGFNVEDGISFFSDATLRLIFTDLVESLENAGEVSVLPMLRSVRLALGLFSRGKFGSVVSSCNGVDVQVNDKDLSKELYKKYSAIHRRKIRAWQMICVLSRFARQDSLGQVTQSLHTSLYRNNLPAVRQYLETFAINIYLKFPPLVGENLVPILRDYDMKPQALSSYVFIAANVILHASEAVQYRHLDELLPPIVPLLTSHHHSLRGFTQLLVYQVLCKLFPPSGSGASQTMPLEKRCFEDLKSYLANNSDCRRLRASMEGYLDAYDPKISVTPAGIFINRVEELEFECVPISLLEQVLTFLNDVREDLRCSMARDVLTIKNESLDPDRMDLSSNAKGENLLIQQPKDTCLDFQKKVTLSKHEKNETSVSSFFGNKEIYEQLVEMEKDDQLLDQLLQSRSLAMERVKASQQTFILVASLLDRIPNLAGLARTCEVFKASGLAIADANILSDKQFQLISVTAEKWVPIIEVPVNSVKVFLEKKKREGFSILGLEQTANSIPLDQFVFPTKTVLVLGREKEGIPVDIIHILDACIEIPQLGVVRSLNVHVSGAIALWEYTRQQRSQ
nr:putative methyltransferase tarbp1 [Quercus suber]